MESRTDRLKDGRTDERPNGTDENYKPSAYFVCRGYNYGKGQACTVLFNEKTWDRLINVTDVSRSSNVKNRTCTM